MYSATVPTPTDEQKLQAIERLCQKHNGPHVVTSTHALAAEILKLIRAHNVTAGDER